MKFFAETTVYLAEIQNRSEEDYKAKTRQQKEGTKNRNILDNQNKYGQKISLFPKSMDN